MKTPIHHPNRVNRLARSSVVALLAGSLTLATGFAQSSSGGTSETGSTSGSETTGTGSSGGGTTGVATDATSSDRRMPDTSSSDPSASSSVKRSEKKFLTKVAKSTPKEIAMAQLAIDRASNPQVKSYAQQIISDHQQMSQQLVQLAQSKGVELENQAQLTSTDSGHGSSHYGTTTASTGSGSSTNPRSDASSMADTGTSNTGSAGMTASTAATGASGSSTHALSKDITSDRHYRNLAEKSGADFDKEFVSTMVDAHKKDLKLFQEQAEDAEDSAIRSFASQHAPVLQGHLDRAQTLHQSVAE